LHQVKTGGALAFSDALFERAPGGPEPNNNSEARHMNGPIVALRKPLAEAPRLQSARGSLWGVVLAGGEGVRLRSLARQVCGDDRPKQYVPLLGRRTMLRHTLDRVALGIASSRTVVVTLRTHARYFDEYLGSQAPRLLVQPADRGTAAGILLPAHWIFRQDPGATVAIFPSDHFILEEEAFMAHVGRVAAWVDENPDRLVLLAARATHAEVEYGWIEPGPPLASAADLRISSVRRFWEKPSEEQARLCLAAGFLWNTFVLVGKAATFLRAGREALPEVDDRLARMSAFFGTPDEEYALHQAYALLAKSNFSRSILEPRPPTLAVAALHDVTWSDLGSPRRVFQVLRRSDTLPSWARVSNLVADER
jgi:mannose-1-phosphate guanylyltransferase